MKITWEESDIKSEMIVRNKNHSLFRIREIHNKSIVLFGIEKYEHDSVYYVSNHIITLIGSVTEIVKHLNEYNFLNI